MQKAPRLGLIVWVLNGNEIGVVYFAYTLVISKLLRSCFVLQFRLKRIKKKPTALFNTSFDNLTIFF
jgi:hypothetical protein